ncbi:hypothetical protein [Salicibibacter cibi]|uniref:hypothetical protein n=1 Tax=Salicibibacter cibi TaxID=2743001 RepID=UPI001FEA0C12|nr:hypothetical protein [Salicibibacter cibi]
MNIAKTLSHKITNHSRIFDATLDIYNDALAFIIEVIDKEFGNLDEMTTKSIVPAVERLMHTTTSNPHPKYRAFNARFYKFPSYFRRSAIASAFGKGKSYRSNLCNWEERKQLRLPKEKNSKKSPPRLQLKRKEFPVFYRGNMFK